MQHKQLKLYAGSPYKLLTIDCAHWGRKEGSIMKKKALAGLLALATVFTAVAPSVNVSAKEIAVEGDTAQGTSDTFFNVTADMLGGGLVVTVPDSVSLEYDEANSQFSKTDKVNAKGYISVLKHLEVSVPTDITYALEDDTSITADGTISFGTAKDDDQVTSWSLAELKTKEEGNLAGIDKDITVTVPMSEVDDVGDYKSVINFDIALVAND